MNIEKMIEGGLEKMIEELVKKRLEETVDRIFQKVLGDEKCLTDEIIEEETVRTPDFPKMVEKAEKRLKKKNRRPIGPEPGTVLNGRVIESRRNGRVMVRCQSCGKRKSLKWVHSVKRTHCKCQTKRGDPSEKPRQELSGRLYSYLDPGQSLSKEPISAKELGKLLDLRYHPKVIGRALHALPKEIFSVEISGPKRMRLYLVKRVK